MLTCEHLPMTEDLKHQFRTYAIKAAFGLPHDEAAAQGMNVCREVLVCSGCW